MNDVDCETILYVLESVTSEAVPSECDAPSLLWYGKAKDKVSG